MASNAPLADTTNTPPDGPLSRVASRESSRPSSRESASGYPTCIGSRRRASSTSLVKVHTQGDGLAATYDQTSDILGSGSDGLVTRVRHRASGQEFAMKSVSLLEMKDWQVAELRQEVAVQRSLSHPNIARVYESYEEDDSLHIIMELCRGGSLVSRFDRRAGFSEPQAATIIEKMLSAVTYCHQHGVVHRDLKLDNFVYEDHRENAELKLIDFGYAFEVTGPSEDMSERLGTLSYMAPELVGPNRVVYDSSVDMWAIGVTAYVLLTGRKPFNNPDRLMRKWEIGHQKLRFDGADWCGVSEHGKDFVKRLLRRDPKRRMNGLEASSHPWIHSMSTQSRHRISAAPAIDGSRKDVLASFRSFADASELKRAALDAIAFATPPARLQELRRIFVAMDADNSGTLSRDEFRSELAQHPQVPRDEIERIFDAVDVSKDGELDVGEFIGAALLSTKERSRALSYPSLLAAFSLLDLDHDGTLSRGELGQTLARVLGADSTERLDALLSAAGVGARLTFEDFKYLVRASSSHASPMDSSRRRACWAMRYETVVTPPLVASVCASAPCCSPARGAGPTRSLACGSPARGPARPRAGSDPPRACDEAPRTPLLCARASC